MGKLKQKKVADELLTRWRSVGPALRSSILDVMISRDDWVADLLDHIEHKQINVHEIDIGRRQQLASLKNLRWPKGRSNFSPRRSTKIG